MFMFLGFIPRNFLGKQTHKKTEKIQLKNEIINLKALIFNPSKIIKSPSHKPRKFKTRKFKIEGIALRLMRSKYSSGAPTRMLSLWRLLWRSISESANRSGWLGYLRRASMLSLSFCLSCCSCSCSLIW